MDWAKGRIDKKKADLFLLPGILPLLGPAPKRNRDYRIGSNFWKFYLIRAGFTLGELVSLVKVFRLFRLEQCGHSR
jgi:hypothetical protein